MQNDQATSSNLGNSVVSFNDSAIQDQVNNPSLTSGLGQALLGQNKQSPVPVTPVSTVPSPLDQINPLVTATLPPADNQNLAAVPVTPTQPAEDPLDALEKLLQKPLPKKEPEGQSEAEIQAKKEELKKKEEEVKEQDLAQIEEQKQAILEEAQESPQEKVKEQVKEEKQIEMTENNGSDGFDIKQIKTK